MKYSEYKCSFREVLTLLALVAAGCGIISYLFYDSFWGMIGSPIVFWLVLKKYKSYKIDKQINQLLMEFIDVLKSISAALLAGYSMENSWKEAAKEIAMLHGEKSMMYKELEEINNSVAMNIPIEKLVSGFAERTDADEIKSFAEIFTFAKRSGGNYVQIIDNTTYRICSKYETEKEIEVTIAAKKLEQKVMYAIPILILAYLRFTSGDYMEALYGNLFGVVFMTICIGIYIGAFFLAEKIMDIRI